ncbi:G2/mitotic-specific cyclin-B [Aspergillus violaceofuscus CBS 115571]|uniref:G2/mitotic-specific cyclin-B n=1 Tax=Aspergillus violaceofuscus (strain CBS 115571) TaxID=1450538 RepID=A0A2V5HI06_ASPV1|nr:G2/mitotic-specific cyclin-B [Aspergillus violaceofuscus CBS 115571]
MSLQARSLRTRGAMNENDENGPSTRLTRAKAAALSSGDAHTTAAATKKPTLQTKKAATATTTGTTRRRAALGDVSNVGKTENGEVKEAKKPAATKAPLAPKNNLPTGGVQKPTKTNPARTNPGVKSDTAKKQPAEPKRPGSGSGIGGNQPRRTTTRNLQQKEAVPEEPPLKKANVEKKEKKPVTEQARDENAQAPIDPKVLEKPTEDFVDDLDAEDLDDPLMAAEYVVEIFDYLAVLEEETLPNPDYIDHQPDLEWKMRGILVDWLIEVHTRFRLLPETLFLAVNIIDRFLSEEVVALDRLQLVGVAAMFIASKYEEVLSPHVANFSHIADETFSDKEILDAERHILATLEYNMSYPNPMNFLRRISKADNYDIQTRTLGKYLMEISLLDHRFMEYRQSHVAAAAMYLARLILARGPWDATLAHYAGYTEEEIDPVFRLMIDYLHRPVSHDAFFKKYASKKFLKASILTRQWAKKYHQLYITSSMSEPYHFIQEKE